MYDRCTWPLNQTISNLVQALKQVKIRAVSRPRTPLETPKGAEWPREHRSTGAGNTDCVSHACIAGGFSKGLLSKNKEGCGYKEVHTYPSSCVKVDYKPTTSDSLREAPQGAFHAGQRGCMAVTSPCPGTTLKVISWGRDLSTNNQPLDETNSNSLNCNWTVQQWLSPGNGTPLKDWDSLPETKKSFHTQGRETPYLWIHGGSILNKCS